MRKNLVIWLGASLLAVGSCQVDTWKMAVGTGLGDNASYLGADVELGNGLSFIVPVFPFDN